LGGRLGGGRDEKEDGGERGGVGREVSGKGGEGGGWRGGRGRASELWEDGEGGKGRSLI